jgi:hypothetical protein
MYHSSVSWTLGSLIAPVLAGFSLAVQAAGWCESPSPSLHVRSPYPQQPSGVASHPPILFSRKMRKTGALVATRRTSVCLVQQDSRRSSFSRIRSCRLSAWRKGSHGLPEPATSWSLKGMPTSEAGSACIPLGESLIPTATPRAEFGDLATGHTSLLMKCGEQQGRRRNLVAGDLIAGNTFGG